MIYTSEPVCVVHRQEGRREGTVPVSCERAYPQSNFRRWLAWALLACSLAVVLYVRLRLLNVPLERDEGEYAYAGQLIIGGLPPYKLAYNMKMPGIYLAYAGIMAVFGQTAAGIHLGLLLVHLASLAALFVITKRLFGLSAAAVATSAYALMTLSPAFLGLAAHATHFVVLPELLGIWLLLRFESARHWRGCFASGCFFGLAFLMKQHAAFLCGFGALYVAWLCVREELSAPSSSVTARRTLSVALRPMSFLVGAVLPFLAICMWLKIAGVFPQFWFWTVSYARQYVSVFTPAQGLRNALYTFGEILFVAPFLWMIAAFGLRLLCVAQLALQRRVFLAGFLGFSVLAVCPGYFFRPHYFILLLPAVCFLIALAVWWSEVWIAKEKRQPWLRHLALMFGLLACAESLCVYHDVLFTLSPTDVCRRVYKGRPFPESLDIARYIASNTRPNERIAVVGSEPEIYFYTHRVSSTGYIYMYPLMEPQPFANDMQAQMIREIEQNPPAYLVFTFVPNSWLMRPTSNRRVLDWVQRYVDENMQLVGLIQYRDSKTIGMAWGNQAATPPLRSTSYTAIYRRVDQP